MLTGAVQVPEPPIWPEPLPTLRVRHVPGKGRGVFALVSFRPGETIEFAPVLLAPASCRAAFMGTALKDYTFRWDEDTGEIAFCLGLGSIYNHSFAPNARYIRHFEGSAIRSLALRAIVPGDEITVNYNGAPNDGSPVWFESLP